MAESKSSKAKSSKKTTAKRKSTSTKKTIGPHLLGRKYEKDDRDWPMSLVFNDIQIPDNSLLDKTVREVHDDLPYFSSWPGILVFWRWVKKVPAGSPTPPSPPGPPAPPRVQAVSWMNPETPLNQMEGEPQSKQGHCVGFGWAQFGNTLPFDDKYKDADGHAIYYEAKVIDGEPNQEDGSTVRSGAQALVNRHRLGAYVFGETMDERKRWVLTQGPGVAGTIWREGMFSPDDSGLVHPVGNIAGGHCYLVTGYDPDGSLFGFGPDVFEFLNSWGTDWGRDGRFYMKSDDWAELVDRRDGEFCAGLELPLSGLQGLTRR